MACACGNALRYGDELKNGSCRGCDDDFNEDLSELTDTIEEMTMTNELNDLGLTQIAQQELDQIAAAHDEQMAPITSFTGEYRWLSNFWESPIDLGNGYHARTVEHAYQALKAVYGTDTIAILGASTPAAAKRLGRAIRVRHDWDQVKNQVMGSLLVAKFGHPHLREKLVATGSREIIEGNTWGDTYWGVCKGVGENHLGKLLMALREALQDEILEQKENALRLEADQDNSFLEAGE